MDVNAQVQRYLRVVSPEFSEEESEDLAEIRRLFAKFDTLKKMGILSELASTLYQSELRK